MLFYKSRSSPWWLSNAETWWKEIRVISTTLQAEERLFTPQLIPHLFCGSAAPPASIRPPAQPSPSTSSSGSPRAAPDDTLWLPSGWLSLSCSGQSALGFVKLSAPAAAGQRGWVAKPCLSSSWMSLLQNQVNQQAFFLSGAVHARSWAGKSEEWGVAGLAEWCFSGTS